MNKLECELERKWLYTGENILTDYNMPVDELIDKLNNAKEKYKSIGDVTVNLDYYEDSSAVVRVGVSHLETDTEWEIRKKLIRDREAKKAARKIERLGLS